MVTWCRQGQGRVPGSSLCILPRVTAKDNILMQSPPGCVFTEDITLWTKGSHSYSWNLMSYILKMGFPHSSVSKESACNTGDPGLIPGSGRFPGEGSGYPFQYSCLKNSMGRGSWRAQIGAWRSMGSQIIEHDWATNTHTHNILPMVMLFVL